MKQDIVVKLTSKDDKYACAFADKIISESQETDDSDNTDLFDKVADLSYENDQLRTKVQILRDKLEKAKEFMKQYVINGRNMLDVFWKRIGEVKEWVYRKGAGISR